MKVRISYIVEVNDGMREAICTMLGRSDGFDGEKATVEEIKYFFREYGVQIWDDMLDMSDRIWKAKQKETSCFGGAI